MSERKEILSFGKYEGTSIRKVPLEYLVWLIKNETQYAWIAKSELKRRDDELNKKR